MTICKSKIYKLKIRGKLQVKFRDKANACLNQRGELKVQSEVWQLNNNMWWPTKVSELNPVLVRTPNLLQHFFNHLLDRSSKPSLETDSTG